MVTMSGGAQWTNQGIGLDSAGNAAGGNGDISFEATSFNHTSGNIVIGKAGTGSLSVNTKASINANDLDIGQALTGNGTVVFSGASGFSSNVNVGNGGIAPLEVANKGSVSATNLLAATADVPQPASVSVDTGGVLQTALQVAIGQNGDAALDIESGGKVQATSVLVAEANGVNASVMLNSGTSNRSTLIYGSIFEIGVLGTADVAISGTAAATPDATDADVLSLGSPVAGSGTLALQDGTLDLEKGVAASQMIRFGNGTDRLQLDTLASTLGTIEGLGAGDSIVLTGTLDDAGAWSSGMLTLTETASVVGTLAIAGSYSASSFKVSNNGTSTTIMLACFATGAGSATVAGRKPVEALAVGDQLPALSGRIATIRWIGHRATDLARLARPWEVMPAHVRVGAFADGVPLRDLVLSRPRGAGEWRAHPDPPPRQRCQHRPGSPAAGNLLACRT